MKEKRLMSFPDNNERGRGENPLSFLLLFCAILRTEVVKRYLSKSMLFDGRCNRLFFYFQKVYKKVLRYAKIF